MRVEVKKVNNDEFFYVDFGSETHGKKSFRLWLSKKIVTAKETTNGLVYEINFPIRGVELFKTPKNTLVLKQGNKNAFNITVKSGYRGSSSIEILDDPDAIILPYYIYHSPLGSLGVSAGALVITTKETVKFKWKRSGRLYGSPAHGITIINIEGNEVDIEDVDNDDLMYLVD